MAALIRHACPTGSRLFSPFRIPKITTPVSSPNGRGFTAKPAKKTTKRVNSKVVRTLESTQISLASRGYLRPHDSYTPSKDASSRLDTVCSGHGIGTDDATSIDDPLVRFKLLEACSKEFNHDVPNSLLHTIDTIGDLREFYLTPIDATVPLDAMRRKDLPPNLHIQYEYHRFHPDTDTMFNGISAFPKSSTLVTGLKYKKKYAGHQAKMSWP